MRIWLPWYDGMFEECGRMGTWIEGGYEKTKNENGGDLVESSMWKLPST